MTEILKLRIWSVGDNVKYQVLRQDKKYFPLGTFKAVGSSGTVEYVSSVNTPELRFGSRVEVFIRGDRDETSKVQSHSCGLRGHKISDIYDGIATCLSNRFKKEVNYNATIAGCSFYI